MFPGYAVCKVKNRTSPLGNRLWDHSCLQPRMSIIDTRGHAPKMIDPVTVKFAHWKLSKRCEAALMTPTDVAMA